MCVAAKPEGKYLKLLCRALHIDPECRDDLPEAIQTAMTKVLSADEIELMEDKYLRRMTTSELSYKHDTVQNLIDLKAREVREKIMKELTVECEYGMPDLITALPYRGVSSTTAVTAGPSVR